MPLIKLCKQNQWETYGLVSKTLASTQAISGMITVINQNNMLIFLFFVSPEVESTGCEMVWQIWLCSIKCTSCPWNKVVSASTWKRFSIQVQHFSIQEEIQGFLKIQKNYLLLNTNSRTFLRSFDWQRIVISIFKQLTSNIWQCFQFHSHLHINSFSHYICTFDPNFFYLRLSQFIKTFD